MFTKITFLFTQKDTVIFSLFLRVFIIKIKKIARKSRFFLLFYVCFFVVFYNGFTIIILNKSLINCTYALFVIVIAYADDNI